MSQTAPLLRPLLSKRSPARTSTLHTSDSELCDYPSFFVFIGSLLHSVLGLLWGPLSFFHITFLIATSTSPRPCPPLSLNLILLAIHLYIFLLLLPSPAISMWFLVSSVHPSEHWHVFSYSYIISNHDHPFCMTVHSHPPFSSLLCVCGCVWVSLVVSPLFHKDATLLSLSITLN